MAFEEIAPQASVTKNLVNGSDQLAVSIRSFRKQQKIPILCVAIGNRLLSKLGWADDQNVRVSLGTGTDHGKIRIGPSQTGFKIKLAKNKQAANLYFCPALGGESYLSLQRSSFILATREVITPSGGGKSDLYISLPLHFFRTPLALPKSAAAE